jgi:hypothetical protein
MAQELVCCQIFWWVLGDDVGEGGPLFATTINDLVSEYQSHRESHGTNGKIWGKTVGHLMGFCRDCP